MSVWKLTQLYYKTANSETTLTPYNDFVLHQQHRYTCVRTSCFEHTRRMKQNECAMCARCTIGVPCGSVHSYTAQLLILKTRSKPTTMTDENNKTAATVFANMSLSTQERPPTIIKTCCTIETPFGSVHNCTAQLMILKTRSMPTTMADENTTTDAAAFAKLSEHPGASPQ